MLKKLFLIAVSGSLLMVAACSTTKVEDKPADAEQTKTVVPPTENLASCQNCEQAGQMMIDSVVKGLTTKDYELYSRDFNEQNKKYFNQKVFKEASDAVETELGQFKKDEYVGFWRKGNYTILLWKAEFSNTPDDVLIEMYVAKEDDTYKIAAVKII